MNNILAAKVLMSHLPEITDGAYKIAIEIAIETLFQEALRDWDNYYKQDISAREYLELSPSDYKYWVLNIGR
jgi:hypothetical protein